MDKTTDHYEVEIRFTFKQANRYGDELPEGTLTFTRRLRARTLTELAQILAKVDELTDNPLPRLTGRVHTPHHGKTDKICHPELVVPERECEFDGPHDWHVWELGPDKYTCPGQ